MVQHGLPNTMNENQIKEALLTILKKDYLSYINLDSSIGSKRLEKDFGITGDDYGELLEKMNEVLGKKMHWACYKGLFHPEAANPFFDIIQIFRKRIIVQPNDPTIDELVRIIFTDIQKDG